MTDWEHSGLDSRGEGRWVIIFYKLFVFYFCFGYSSPFLACFSFWPVLRTCFVGWLADLLTGFCVHITGKVIGFLINYLPERGFWDKKAIHLQFQVELQILLDNAFNFCAFTTRVFLLNLKLAVMNSFYSVMSHKITSISMPTTPQSYIWIPPAMQSLWPGYLQLVTSFSCKL